jgi:NitT/TauT family transport system substrate-binding protein
VSRRAGTAGAVLLAAGLALAGCSEAPSSGLRRVRVLAQHHLSQAPLLLAHEEGYFREAGLDVEMFSAQSSRDGLPALVQGDLEVLTGSLAPAYLSAIAQGARIRVVADKGHLARDHCTYTAFLVRPESLAGGALRPRRDGGRWISSFTRGTYHELLFSRAIAQAGLSADQFEIHHLDGEAKLQALAQGRLDVVSSTGANLQALVDAGTAAIWKTAEEVWPDAQYAVLLFGPPLLDDDPDAGERFMAAYLRGVRQYNLGKTERNLELLSRRTGIPRADLERACWIAVREDGRVDLQSVEELRDWSLERGILPRRVPISEIWEPRFVEAAAKRRAS